MNTDTTDTTDAPEAPPTAPPRPMRHTIIVPHEGYGSYYRAAPVDADNGEEG